MQNDRTTAIEVSHLNSASRSRCGSRVLFRSSLLVAASIVVPACSSGLEPLDPRDSTGRVYEASTNTRFMFDPCLALTNPISEVDITGGVIPTSGGSRERPVAFVAFVTSADAADADGEGTSLDTDFAANGDMNDAADVFIAAVDADQIDERAFDYAIAGTMRHDRCRTCHQMNLEQTHVPAPTPFMHSAHFLTGGGEPPLNEFTDHTCADCHFHDWLAPGPGFDLRGSTTADLFARAQVPPAGLDVHFSTDPRVLWALGIGQNPFGRAADNDHDGVVEPEDFDGVRRHAPGGIDGFIDHLNGWLETIDPVSGVPKFSSAPEAVQDTVCASRNAAGTAAGNGASSAPSLVYVPNGAFDPNNPTAVAAGSLFVAYQSVATDMNGGGELISGGVNVFNDIFRVKVDVFIDVNGNIDLRYDVAGQVHVSAGVMDPANGNSTAPDIGGTGNRIAYVSEAQTLVGGFAGDCRPEVYLWDSGTGNALVSHQMGSAVNPADAGSINARISSDGNAVSFESDATNLIAGDTNGARDVFYAVAPMLDVVRASVDENGRQFPGHSHAGSVFRDSGTGNVRVAFACRDLPLDPITGIPCVAEMRTMTPFMDASIRSDQIGTTERRLLVGIGGGGSPPINTKRSLVRFNVAGTIPAGATVVSATLTLRSIASNTGTQNVIGLHRITSDWDHSTVNWGDHASEFESSASATRPVGTSGLQTWSGTELANDVQFWLDNPLSDFGWMMIGTAPHPNVKEFRNSETGPPAPMLTVTYFEPLPLQAASTSGVPGSSHVFLRDTALNRTVRLDQIVGPDSPGEAELRAPAASTNPVISPYGNAVLFESAGTPAPALVHNLDFVRPFDENRKMDVVLVDLQQFETSGYILPYTLSVTADGGFGDDDSHTPLFAPFNPPTDAFPLGLATFSTQAMNLGNTDPADPDLDGVLNGDNFMMMFLSEGASVVADFRPDPPIQGQNRYVVFESRSSGKPVGYTWDFGDGTISHEPRPVHAYSTPGEYTVSLTVSGPLGTDSRTRTDVVRVLDVALAKFSTTKDFSESVAQNPVNNFDADSGIPIDGAIDDNLDSSRLLFSMNSSASEELPDSFTWRLRSLTPPGPNPIVSTEPNPSGIVIDRPGIYELNLDARGPGGGSSLTQAIHVFQAVESIFTTSVAPTASIVGDPIVIDAGTAVMFMDASTGDLDVPTPHSWNLGGGDVSTLANPSKTFNTAGIFNVELAVAGRGGDMSTSTQTIVSRGNVTSLFSLDPDGPAPPGLLNAEAIATGPGNSITVDFTNESSNQAMGAMTFLWTFGAGGLTGQESNANPTNIQYTLSPPFEDVETFNIGLIAFGPGGNNFSTGQLTLYPQPTVDFNAAPSFSMPANRPPHTVMFTSTVVGDRIGTNPTYRWLRGTPGNTACNTLPGTETNIVFSTEANPVFEFAEPGDYKIALEVTTNGPDGTRQSVMSPVRDVTVTAARFSDWYTQAIDPATGARCTNCHSGPNAAGGGLDWEIELGETISDVRARLLLVPSTRCNGAFFRIDPCNVEGSVVHNVLTNPSGPLCGINMRINLAGEEDDKDAAVEVLASWINGGALDD